MKLTFLGHAAWKIEGSKSLFIDPWLNDNPAASCKANDIGLADYIFVTHDHFDHLGDSHEIAKNTGATIVSIFETAAAAENAGLKTVGCNIGGPVKLDNVEAIFTQAFHSMTSNPSGVVIKMDGRTIYHAGDTCLFGDMKLIGELYPLDVAILPIGGHFTMGVREAAKAVELLQPQRVLPMHYDTFEVIEADLASFREAVGNNSEVCVVKSGDCFDLSQVPPLEQDRKLRSA